MKSCNFEISVLLKRMPTRHLDNLTCNHLSLLTGQKQNGFCNILRLDQLAHRDNRYDFFCEIIVNPPCLSRTWSHTVHGNAVFCYFKCDATCECFQSRLACTIGNLTCKDLCSICGKIDNSAVIATMLNKFPRLSMIR